MKDVNHVVLVGRLVKNIVVTSYGDGSAIGNFTIANNASKKTQNGWEDQAHYFAITAYGKLATNLQPYLLKGKQVIVEGALRQNVWVDNKTQQKHYDVFVLAENIQLLGGNKNKDQEEQTQPQQYQQQPQQTQQQYQQQPTQQQQNFSSQDPYTQNPPMTPQQVQQLEQVFNGTVQQQPNNQQELFNGNKEIIY